MNLSKWNDFIVEQDETTIMNPSQIKNTEMQDTIEIPYGQMSSVVILNQMGYEAGQELGKGKYGTVIKVTDQETRNQFAAKIVMGSPLPDIKRETRNYKFLIDNRDKLGIRKKYFPKVYYSEIKSYRSEPNENSANPPIFPMGIIIMELLAPLPSHRPFFIY